MMKKLLLIALLFPLFASAQLNVPQGGTGQTTFPQGAILVGGTSSLRLLATTSPTVGYVTATSGTSTIANLNVTGGVNIGGSFFTNLLTFLTSVCSTITGGSGLCDGNDAVGSGSGTVATSTNETKGQIPFWTTNGASVPATLGSVATTSLSVSGPFTLSGTLGALIGGANSILTWAGLATTSQPASSNLLVSNGSAGVYGVATSSITGTGIISLSNAIAGIGGSASAISVTGGTNGQVLAWLGGVPTWTASTSIAAGTNITISTAGSVTTINSTSGGGTATDTAWQIIPAGVRLTTTTNQVLIGANATTSRSNLEVAGGATIWTTATVTTLVATGTGSSTFSTGVIMQSEASGTRANFDTATSTFRGITITGMAGILKAVAGNIGTALVSLTADITGTLGIGNGGTNATALPQLVLGFNGTSVVGTSTPYVAAIVATSTTASSSFTGLFASSTYITNANVANYFTANGLTSCNGASNALTWAAGVFGCNTITGGGGGAGAWATTTNNLLTYLPTTWTALIGGTSTTTNSRLEVVGSSTFNGRVTANQEITAPYFNATSSTSTFAGVSTTDMAISKSLSFGGVVGRAWSDFCTAITGGSGLCDGDDATGSGTATDTPWQMIPGGLRLTTSTNQVLIGASATSTNSNLDVVGSSTVSGNLTTTGMLRVGASFGSESGALRVNGNVFTSGSFSIPGLTELSQGSLYAASTLSLKTSDAVNRYSIITIPGGSSITNIGRVGIGSTTPWGTLSVVNQAFTPGATPLLVVASTTLGNSTTTHLILDNTGKLGIGTSSPYARLSVAGPVVADSFNATNTAATSTFTGLQASSSLISNLNVPGYFTANGLTSCNGASNALTWNAGVFGCNTITGGAGGSAGAFATNTQNNLTYITTQWSLLVGGTATTSNSRLEVVGGATIYSGATTSDFIATSSASTTNLYISGKAGGVLLLNGNSSTYTTTTSTPAVSAPITYSGTLGNFIGGTSGNFGCTSATRSVTGCLTSTDFTTFDNKISSTSLSGASVISYTSGTGVITTTGGTFGAGNYTFPTDLTVTGNGTSSIWSVLTFASTSALRVSNGATTTNLAIIGLGAGMLKTNAGGAVGLGTAGTDYVAPATTITVAGTANQITSSAGAQDLSTNRTWTLSLPSAITFPGSITGPSESIGTSTIGTLLASSSFASQGTSSLNGVSATYLNLNGGNLTGGNATFVGVTTTGTVVSQAGTSSLVNLSVTELASTTNFAVSRLFSLFGSSYTTANALCIGLTGSVDLCDGSDASGGGSAAQLPTYIVAASGGTHTTIQTALDSCGTAGGGNIILTDTTYAQGGTGLRFKGSNCHVIGRGIGTTTVTFTGATTMWGTNSAAGQYTHNSIEGLTVTADSNASGIAFDLSDMSHFILTRTKTDGVGTWVRHNDTQNVTFYQKIYENQATTLISFGVNASSTNPVNFNSYRNNFLGCSANCVAFQFNNGNKNIIAENATEPGSTTGTYGIKIYDNGTASNDGFFQNTIRDNYIEGNAVGISVSVSVASGGGIKRNTFEGNLVDANTLDYVFPGSATSSVIALQTWINNMDSNFGNPLTSFQQPFGVGTSSVLESIGATPFAAFAVHGSTTIANNIAAFGHTSGTSDLTDLIINGSGFVGLGTTSPYARLSVVGQVVASSFNATTSTSTFTGASTTQLTANNSTSTFRGLQLNGRDCSGLTNGGKLTTDSSGNIICSADTSGGGSLSGGVAGTLTAWVDGTTVTATSTPNVNAINATSTTATSTFVGKFSVGSSTPDSTCFFCVGSSSPLMTLNSNGKMGFYTWNTSPALAAFGSGSNGSINTAFKFIVQDTSDARIGAFAGSRGVGLTTGDATTYGALYAYDYIASNGMNLVLNQFGGNVGIGTTSPLATLSITGVASKLMLAVASSSGATVLSVIPDGSLVSYFQSGTTTKANAISDTNYIPSITAANYGATYSDDLSRTLECGTAAASNIQLRNKGFANAAQKYIGTTGQTIIWTSLFSATVVGRGCITYQGYHYVLYASTTAATFTAIRRATSSDFNDLSVATNWATSTISGVALTVNDFIVGVANNQIYIATSTTAIGRYTISTSSNTLTYTGTITLSGTNILINNTRVNQNGIYAGFGAAPFTRKADLSGNLITNAGNVGVAVPSTTGPDMFVTPNSLYGLYGNSTTLLSKILGY